MNIPQYQTYPMTYPQPMYAQNSYPAVVPNTKYGINWVQGIEGAKAIQIPANNNAVLLDSEQNRLYIKTADNIGLSTLRIFDLSEITDVENVNTKSQAVDMSQYVTKQELDAVIEKLSGGKKDEFVSTTEQQTYKHPKSK